MTHHSEIYTNNIDKPIKLTDIKVNKRILVRKQTSLRRASMLIKVLTFNLAYNHLSFDKKSYLNLLFKEAKYYYNYLLAWTQFTIIDDFGNLLYPNNLKNVDCKNNCISIFNSLTQSSFDYKIQYLSSQMKQKILDKLLDNIKGLSVTKSKGRKTGKLKFKSLLNIPLKQFNNTFYLDDDCKYLSIQGCVKELNNFKLHRNKAFKSFAKELGLKNLSLNNLIESNVIEIANAELIKVGHQQNVQYKLNLTIYINPDIYNEDKEYEPLVLIESTKNKRFNKNRILMNTQSNLNNKRVLNYAPSNLNNIDKKIKQNIDQNLIKTNLSKQEIIKPIEELKETYLSQFIKQFHMNFTKEQRDIISCASVGIDAGIASEFTLSFGGLYESVKLDSRNNEHLLSTLNEIKLTQTYLNKFINRSKKLNRKKNKDKSKNESKSYNKSRDYYHIKNKLNKLWTHYENIKTNMVNHLVSYLKQFKQVYFQDEMIKNWHQDTLKGYGKKIQAGILGKVYAKLKLLHKLNPSKYIMLTKSVKTTQTCMNKLCNKINPIKLNDRIYHCVHCGYINDRDSHSAYSMISMGSKLNTTKNKVDNEIEKVELETEINVIQEFGRNSVNLVKDIASINNIERNFSVIVDKLCSKSYIKATLNSFM